MCCPNISSRSVTSASGRRPVAPSSKPHAPSLSITSRSSEENPDRVSPNGPPLPGSAARGAAPHTKPRRPHSLAKGRRRDADFRSSLDAGHSCGPAKLCVPPKNSCPSRVTQLLCRSKPRLPTPSRASGIRPTALRRPHPSPSTSTDTIESPRTSNTPTPTRRSAFNTR